MSEIECGQTLDQYELLEVVARSGMATIFRARDTGNGRTVAVKVPHLLHQSDIVFHQRFLREEQIGQRLNHPAIVKIMSPKQKSCLYLVEEYLEGELLSQRLQRDGRLSIDIGVGLAVQIADALAYLHEHQVAHRDLKPDNIMILKDGKVKVIDFGIALDTTQRKLTWSGLSQAMGTPDYMAPEQVKGRRGDARTDIYSLGVILYEMMTGKIPFSNENVYAAMRAKVHGSPIPPSRHLSGLSPQIEEIILHAIERDPSDRFQSAAELREALTRPGEVALTDRAARKGQKPGLSRWWRRVIRMMIDPSKNKE
ncbi:MAG TPA: serine/threonine-protein kinase [Candidatus Manganitrophaceae bacterium]|nr:serine/threonine-protein kinase [Candidatus Manganitrophaceae bacterium]